MNPVEGYLVVRQEPGVGFRFPPDVPNLNPRYMGVSRIPCWPSKVAEENAALELYVFNYRDDDTNLIPTLARAEELLNHLRHSPIKYEIIRCQELSPGAQLAATPWPFLGVDVVSLGDYWSIVGCFPEASDMQSYLRMLNANGLFDSPDVAFGYVHEYVDRKLERWDDRYDVLGIWRVQA
jgi:hypothetical protein